MNAKPTIPTPPAGRAVFERLTCWLCAIGLLGMMASLPLSAQHYVYFTTQSATAASDRLGRVFTDGSGSSFPHSGNSVFTQPGKMAIDSLRGKVYVADGTGGEAIRRFNLDGSGGATVVGNLGAACSGIALDTANQIIYFTTSGGDPADDTLRRVKFDGSDLTTLHSGNSLFIQPAGLALDVANGKIYVADGTGGEAIRRLNLDGSGGTTVVNSLGAACVDVALDVPNQRIYFLTSSGTASLDRLQRVAFDGTSLTTLHSGNTVFIQPCALAADLVAGKIYVADGTGGSAVRSFNLDGSGGTTVLGSLGAAVSGVAILRPPAVQSVSATTPNGFYTTGASIAITVTFDQPVTVSGGVPKLQLNSGGSIFASYSAGSGSTTLQFAYSVAAGEVSADLDYTSTSALGLNGATISGFEAQAASLTLPTPGLAGSLGANRNLAIDAVNDAPTITGAAAGQTVNDNTTLAPFANVTISDSDLPAQTLSVTVALDTAAKGQFSVLNGFSSAGSGGYTFTGTAAAATTAIRGLVFNPTDNRVAVGGTETTTFTITANDSLASPVTNNATTVISTSINDAPVAVADSITRPPGVGIKVALAELLANDTDADGDSLSLSLPSATSANGAPVTIEGRWVVYPAPVNDNPDSFTYTASDGRGGLATGTVTVSVQGRTEQSQNLVRITADGLDKVIRFAGIPGRSYTLQYTSDLGTPSWASLETKTAGLTGLIEFRDQNPPLPSRYYRTTSP